MHAAISTVCTAKVSSAAHELGAGAPRVKIFPRRFNSVTGDTLRRLSRVLCQENKSAALIVLDVKLCGGS